MGQISKSRCILFLLATAFFLPGCTAGQEKWEKGAADQGSDVDFLSESTSYIGGTVLPAPGEVALTFDDGPHPTLTPLILDILKRHGIRATFFVTGVNAEKQRSLLKRIVAEGHLLANHAYEHHSMLSYSGAALAGQLTKVDQVICDLNRGAGNPLYFFRAPYGAWGAWVAKYLNEIDAAKHYIGPVFWNAGSRVVMNADGAYTDAADWECGANGIDACVAGYTAKIESNAAGAGYTPPRPRGSIVLMHDIQPITPKVLTRVLDRLGGRYGFIRMDEINGIDQLAGGAHQCGGSTVPTTPSSGDGDTGAGQPPAGGGSRKDPACQGKWDHNFKTCLNAAQGGYCKLGETCAPVLCHRGIKTRCPTGCKVSPSLDGILQNDECF